MRLFIAIEMPEQVVAELKRVQGLLTGAKMKKVETFHLTLKFLGDVADSRVEKIIEELHGVGFKPFKARLTSIGVFPNLNYVRVVWVGIAADEIMMLQKEIESRLSSAGFKSDKRFHPHVTLARVRMINNKDEFSKCLQSIKVEKLEFEVNEFKLIKSTLTQKGPVYNSTCEFA